MKIKALREKRNNLVAKLETMVSALENENGEVRALGEEELKEFRALEKEVKDIDATISIIEETRAAKMGAEEEVKLKEKRSKDEMEKRALEAFFRGEILEAEDRAMLASNSANKATIPLTISKTLMKKLEEQCPILETAKRFNSKGTLRLLREDSYGAATLTDENTEFHGEEPTIAYVELTSHKVTAYVDATFEMLQNTGIDLSSYLTDVIIRRLSKKINELFLVGTGSKQPQGLTKAAQQVELGQQDGVTINDFINLQTTMLPEYAQGAKWIMNRKFFQIAANLLDGNGRPYMTREVIGEKIQYMFLGHEIIVDMFMPDASVQGNVPVLLANIGEAYAINMLQDITVRHLTEIGFTNGFERFAGYLMADGKIVNEDAIVAGVVPSAMVLSTKKK